jgi:putative flippase GtrA
MGLFVHLAVLAALNRGLGVAFILANLFAATVAVTFNFFVNNLVIYRDMRLKGFWPVLRGLVSFAAICSIGTAANVGIAVVLFQRDYTWWLAAGPAYWWARCGILPPRRSSRGAMSVSPCPPRAIRARHSPAHRQYVGSRRPIARRLSRRSHPAQHNDE